MTQPPFGPPAFQAAFDVSRETMARLMRYHDLLLKWNARINLIARSGEPEIWRRHFADSAQLLALAPQHFRHWLDIGAGAGFPGLVVAALSDPPRRITLVESDTRKAVFLGEAARAMDLDVAIVSQRIESLDPAMADVVSARALAPLDRLLVHLEKHRSPDGIGLFPKGETVHKEIGRAASKWRFDHRIHPSFTDPGAAIVEIGAVSRV